MSKNMCFGFLVCIVYGICNKNNYTKDEWLRIIESGGILNLIEIYLDDLLVSENELLKYGIKKLIIQIYDDNKNNGEILNMLETI